jgi:hypothetical protein
MSVDKNLQKTDENVKHKNPINGDGYFKPQACLSIFTLFLSIAFITKNLKLNATKVTWISATLVLHQGV